MATKEPGLPDPHGTLLYVGRDPKSRERIVIIGKPAVTLVKWLVLGLAALFGLIPETATARLADLIGYIARLVW
jgi:hypothetical protein